MSKTKQREQSYLSAGRSAGLDCREFKLGSTLRYICKQFIKSIPKRFRSDWYLGWKAGLAGIKSNKQIKLQKARSLLNIRKVVKP